MRMLEYGIIAKRPCQEVSSLIRSESPLEFWWWHRQQYDY